MCIYRDEQRRIMRANIIDMTRERRKENREKKVNKKRERREEEEEGERGGGSEGRRTTFAIALYCTGPSTGRRMASSRARTQWPSCHSTSSIRLGALDSGVPGER